MCYSDGMGQEIIRHVPLWLTSYNLLHKVHTIQSYQVVSAELKTRDPGKECGWSAQNWDLIEGQGKTE